MDLKFYDKRAILFDLDGTLIDSVPDLAFSINYMLDTLNMPTYNEETIRYWVGNGASTLVKRALLGDVNSDQSVDEKLFTKALDIFLSYYSQHLTDSTQLYPNVFTTLKELKQKGYNLVVVTNKPILFVAPILSGLGIDDLFDFHLGGDSLKVKKPHPQPLLYACSKLNISPHEVVMVGDSKNDILSANSANIESIGVTYGYNYKESIRSYNPSITVDDFAHIAPLFGSANSSNVTKMIK